MMHMYRTSLDANVQRNMYQFCNQYRPGPQGVRKGRANTCSSKSQHHLDGCILIACRFLKQQHMHVPHATKHITAD